jgi:hypothetical protein
MATSTGTVANGLEDEPAVVTRGNDYCIFVHGK